MARLLTEWWFQKNLQQRPLKILLGKIPILEKKTQTLKMNYSHARELTVMEVPEQEFSCYKMEQFFLLAKSSILNLKNQLYFIITMCTSILFSLSLQIRQFDIMTKA